MSTIGTTPPTTPPGSAESVHHPAGGEQEVKSKLAHRDKKDFYRSDPAQDFRTLKFLGIGAGVGVLAGAPVGFRMAARSYAPTTGTKLGGAIAGAAIGAVLLGAAGWGMTNFRKPIPELVNTHAERSVDWSARERPPLPAASDAPVVDETPGIGVTRPGITGSNAGQGVRLQQTWLERSAQSVTTRTNDEGEPVLSIGDVDNTVRSYEEVVVRQDVRLNPLGLGRVLYDPNGYATQQDAMDAYDGRHAVAVVQDGDRYYIADLDAQNYDGLGGGSNSLMISDKRVSALMVSEGVYYPTNLEVGSPAPNGVNPGPTSRLFLFAHDQDIPKSVPASLNGLVGTSIGWYDTNAPDRRNEVTDPTNVRVGRVHGVGDEGGYDYDSYSGPAFGSRDEAIEYVTKTEGTQGVVRAGQKYYVVDVDRERSLDETVGKNTLGAYVHGLRTDGAASQFEVIEDAGGLYAPVGSWWVRTRPE